VRIFAHDPSPKKLIYMANQIGKFFAPRTKFWDLSMRKKIVRHLSEGGRARSARQGTVQRVGAKQVDEAGYSGEA
jgi:NADH-dependant formate dehydrogenase delta subunit FdsD